MKESKTTITINAEGKELELKIDCDTDIEGWIETFKTILIFMTFSADWTEKIFNDEF